MGMAKKAYMEEQSDAAIKEQNKIDGYRKKLRSEGKFAIDCPYCDVPLSHDDIKMQACRHCNYEFEWSK